MIQSFLHIKLIIRRTERTIKIERILEEATPPTHLNEQTYKSENGYI